MEKLKSSHLKTLWISIILSVGFVGGVLAIIFGATKGVTILLVIGIIATVLGFYGSPILWIKYGEQFSYIAVLDCIVSDNLLDIDSIATSLGKMPQEVLRIVNYLVTKRYLKGYYVENGKLKPIENEVEDVVVTHKCPNCGATIDTSGQYAVCEYCGVKLKLDKRKR